MNFFEHQDKARSTTKKLVVLFCLAILTLIFVTSILVAVFINFTPDDSGNISTQISPALLTSDIFVMVGLGVLAVVGLGSAWRFAQLSGGGKSIAESLGGRLLNVSTRDADERKMLNVVEEMAIAAGLPVPPVYLIDDDGINAFAAGYHQKDAVIGVTRGCIRLLSRDELQGVIAHEFSHIFNGDMKLNIRLIGLLYGILVIGMIGYFIMRSTMYRGRRSDKGGAIVFLGLGLVIVGYGGTFFGNLIKAAVSRQREYLADASAVQFTRNPEGISGALQKIGGYSAGSHITSVETSEISHMLFGEGVSRSFSAFFATHPPLKERIKRIDPNWSGRYPEVELPVAGSHQRARAASSEAPVSPVEMASSGFAAGFNGQSGQSMVDSIGNPTPEHVVDAIEKVHRIPEELHDEAHNTYGATALMFALMIFQSEQGVREGQLAVLKDSLTDANFTQLKRVLELIPSLQRDLYLPLIDIALPSLKQQSPTQYRHFMSLLSQMMIADQEISLFEWSIFKILRYNLDRRNEKNIRHVALKNCIEDCSVLLSVLAIHSNPDDQIRAFDAGADVLGMRGQISLKAPGKEGISALDKAVGNLKKLKPLQKPQLLKAMVKTITSDNEVRVEEKELLRALGSLLDCPIPPILPGQALY